MVVTEEETSGRYGDADRGDPVRLPRRRGVEDPKVEGDLRYRGHTRKGELLEFRISFYYNNGLD